MILSLKIIVILSYVFMIIMNFLANYLPFNGQDTGTISDKYPSLFTPSGFTFSIWGIIYIFLGIYVFKIVTTTNSEIANSFFQTTMIIFIITSLLNVMWLLFWHYDHILMSTITMAAFLVLLLIAMTAIPSSQILIKTAFSLYAAWLSIAFIANVTILIIDLNIKFFLSKEVLWYSIIIVIGVIILAVLLLQNKNVVYSLVFLWAYFGIFMKHKTQVGHFITNPGAINLTTSMLIIISVMTVLTFVLNDWKLFPSS